MRRPRLAFVTLDVFTQTRFAGNPLAIVRVPPDIDDTQLSTAHMQRIAREFNLSETVFLHERPAEPSSSGVPEWRIRIFLTNAEVPFAGHPTIGTACYVLSALAPATSTRARLRCAAGLIDVSYDRATGVAQAAIPHAVHVHSEQPFTVSELRELQPGLAEAKLSDEDIKVVSPVKGMNFICARLATLEDLGRVAITGRTPRARLDREWDDGFTASYFYVVTESGEEGSKLRSRMIEGTFEDPASGSAVCGLAAYLALEGKVAAARRRVSRFEVVQGYEMGRQSDIGVVVTLTEGMDKVETIELSGAAVPVMEGWVESA